MQNDPHKNLNTSTHQHLNTSTHDLQHMNKVLIVTYYWPPSGGSGVQRWLKFVKYLPSFGWEPHVFTPENPSFAIQDASLEKDVPPEAEVMRLPIWEPYDIFFSVSRLMGSKKQATPTSLVSGKNQSLFQKATTWIRGNMLIPDPRVFWVRPSVKFLSDYVQHNHIKVIITTGPPHSIHLIGLKLKNKYPDLRWLADFRDPWTEWGMWDSLMVSQPVRRLHKRLESKVLAKADEVITITPFYARRFEALSGRLVRLLTNGYDEDDFKSIVYKRTDKFIIRHVGIVNEKCDPRPFMTALASEMKLNPAFAGDVCLEFIGEVHPDFRRFVSDHAEMNNVTSFVGHVPHEELIGLYGSSSLLLLILSGYKDAEGFLPGKLFEYFAAGLPVLGVGPVHGDAGTLLNETGAGTMVATEDLQGIRQALRKFHNEWLTGEKPKGNASTAFSRKTITAKLAGILGENDIQ